MTALSMEKFSERAVEVMRLANQEARSFNHEYVGTEHLLAGLAKEEKGFARGLLLDLHIDLRKIRLHIDQAAPYEPDMTPSITLTHTPRLIKVIQFATEEATKLRVDMIRPEHFLLGVLRLAILNDPPCKAREILLNLEVHLETAYQGILDLLQSNFEVMPTLDKKSRETKPLKIHAATYHRIDLLSGNELDPEFEDMLRVCLNIPEGHKIKRVIVKTKNK